MIYNSRDDLERALSYLKRMQENDFAQQVEDVYSVDIPKYSFNDLMKDPFFDEYDLSFE